MIASPGLSLTTDETSRRPAYAMNDPAAFELIFQEHWSRVYGVLFRLVGDHTEAEDLALETFWRLYRRPPRQATNLAGWLYRVATNLGYNALRARQRRGRYEQQAGRIGFLEHTSGDPAIQLENAERAAAVRRVLAHMQPRAASLLVLRQAGLTYAELAAALDLAPGSVGTLLARAEKDFAGRYQKLLEKDGID
jgi:RNA polymerase sigma-70 factor (ECF subfamily)